MKRSKNMSRSIALCIVSLLLGCGALTSCTQEVKISDRFTDAVKDYETVGTFSEGLAPVQDESEKWGFIDTKGKLVIPCKYGNVGIFRNGLAPVSDSEDGYGADWYYINKDDKKVSKRYGQAFVFPEGEKLAMVSGESDSGEYGFGYINSDGEEVIPCQYP